MNWKQRLDFALPFVAMLLIAALLLLAGCTVDQTDSAIRGVEGARDAVGAAGDTIGPMIPGSRPWFTLAEGVLGVLALGLGIYSKFQRDRRKEAEELESEAVEENAEMIAKAAKVVTTLDTVLTPEQKQSLSAKMPEPAKQFVRVARAVA